MLAAWTALLAVTANPPGPDPDWLPPGDFGAAEVTRAARDCASADYWTREAGSARLLAGGARALPHLRQLLAWGPRPEVKCRLEAAEARLALARLMSPRLVTLNLRDAPIRDALQQVTRLTGYTFTTIDTYGKSVPNAKRVSFECENLPFLQAMDLLCGSNGLGYYISHPSGVVAVHTWPTRKSSRAYAGPYRVTAGSAFENSRFTGLEGSNDPKSPDFGKIYVKMWIDSEPKNAMLGVNTAYPVSSLDRAGRRTDYPEPLPGDDFYYCQPARRFQHDAAVAVRAGDKRFKSLAEVTFKFVVVLVAETRVADRVDDLARAKGRKLNAGGVQAIVDEVTPRGDGFEVRLGLLYPGWTGAADEWAPFAAERLRAVDANGRVLPGQLGRREKIGQGATDVTVRFRGATTGPVALEFLEWRTREQEVTVTVKDVPLPAASEGL